MTDDNLFYLFTGILIGYFACGVSFDVFKTKKEDVRKIQQMIDALKLVIDYYSVPEGDE